MDIVNEKFGKLPDGREVTKFTLDNNNGVTAHILDYGGIVQSLQTPDRDGRPGEIGLGFDTLEGYLAKPNFYGALIGRIANRIKAGRFTLDGVGYQLPVGPDGNHLHGGPGGFNTKLWKVSQEGGILRLDYLSPDGEEGYPGNLKVTVWYSIAANDFRIDYEAETDKPTIINLTNHTFFNLNGCVSDILRHEVRIQAESYTAVDASCIPTGEIVPVKGTPFDFTKQKPIGRDLAGIPTGYDHNFIFAGSVPGADQCLVDVYDPDSGRTMSMATTEPCTQLYIGNFMDGTEVGSGGRVFKHRHAFCLEAQKHPDAINHPNFASTVLRPGETYRQTTVYRFGRR